MCIERRFPSRAFVRSFIVSASIAAQAIGIGACNSTRELTGVPATSSTRAPDLPSASAYARRRGVSAEAATANLTVAGHVSALAGTTQATQWFYFQSASTGRWYIANDAGYIYMLDDVGPQYTGNIGWRPINAPPGSSLAQDAYPPVGNVFSSVNISADGRTVSIGGSRLVSPTVYASAIQNSTLQIQWLYFYNPATGWYITEAGSAGSVFYLDVADPSIAGGIGWAPVYNATFPGYPDAGLTFSSVSLGSGRRSTLFGGAASGSTPPSVTGMKPGRLVGLDAPQWVSLAVKDFPVSGHLEFCWTASTADCAAVTGSNVRKVNADTVKAFIVVGSTPSSTWRVHVVDANGAKSGEYAFSVQNPTTYSTGTFIGEINTGSGNSFTPIFADAPADEPDGPWQCVELVRRYLANTYGFVLPAVGVAQNIYKNAASLGLHSSPNNSADAPRPGNLLVFTSADNIGHVGVIVYVSPTQLWIAQQNWVSATTPQLAYMPVSYSVVNGKYQVASAGKNGAYQVSGWVWP